MIKILVFFTVFLMVTSRSATAKPSEPVNAVIGDRSAQGLGTPLSEQNRLIVHLSYVENRLRERSTIHLSKDQRAARLRVLDRLHAYRLKAEFPRNTYVPQRTPVFIDKQGVRCAVGAIAEPDIGSEEVERIGHSSRLSYLFAIKSDKLHRWAHDSGFSLLELAMIQPSYHFRDPNYSRAQGRLGAAWRTCRAEVYPVNVGSSSRFRNTVTFTKANKDGRLAADIVLKLPKRKRGTHRNPAPSDEALNGFISCVQNRFAGGSYTGTRPRTYEWIPVRNGGRAVVDERTGLLRENPAKDYIKLNVETLRKKCKMPPEQRWKVKIRVRSDGGVESVSVKSRPLSLGQVERCISSNLSKSLHFPVSVGLSQLRILIPQG